MSDDDTSTKIGAITVAKAAVWVVYAVLVVYVIILLIAFFLLLLGANPDTGFVDWIYHASERMMAPFRGIFPVHELSDKAVFEPSYLFAIVIYTILALAAHALIDWLGDHADRLRRDRDRDRYYANFGTEASRGYGAQGYGGPAYGQGYQGAPQAAPPAGAQPAPQPPAPPAGGTPGAQQ